MQNGAVTNRSGFLKLWKGWDVEYPKCVSGVYSMVIHKCIYQQIFSKYGMP